MTIESDDDHSQRAEAAVGGRLPGGNCPHDAALFIAASSDYLPSALKAHLDECAVCRRTHELATPTRHQSSITVVDYVNHDSKVHLLSDDMALLTPSIRAFNDGCVHCVVGRDVLLLTLERFSPQSSWGTSCLIRGESCPIQVRPDVISVESLFPWQLGESIVLTISNGSESDELVLDWGGWGNEIHWIAVAFHPDTVKQVQETLHSFEEILPIWEPVLRRDPYGFVSDGALSQLIDLAEPRLRRILTTWKWAASFDSKYFDLALEDALQETWKMLLRDRNSVPEVRPIDWLLQKSATSLATNLKSHIGVSRPHQTRDPQSDDKPENEVDKLLSAYKTDPAALLLPL